MKKLLLALLCYAVFYTSNGSMIITQECGSFTYYYSNGRSIGYSQKIGSYIYFYDASGRQTGYRSEY